MIARYGINWGATGPRIEKHGINLERVFTPEGIRWKASKWFGGEAEYRPGRKGIEEHSLEASGHAALLAVCYLLLALAVNGKLGQA